MEDWKERVLVEKDDLYTKLSKLDQFIASDAFSALSSVHKSLLKVQYAAMVSYHECLNQRLEL